MPLAFPRQRALESLGAAALLNLACNAGPPDDNGALEPAGDADSAAHPRDASVARDAAGSVDAGVGLKDGSSATRVDAAPPSLEAGSGKVLEAGSGKADAGANSFDDGYFDGASRLNGLPETSCTVTVSSSDISSAIATVGIVSFTTDLPELKRAEIHFGPDTNYGLVAPVDLTREGFRTLLLGMVQDSTYHYRIAVSDGTSVCYGEDERIVTGSLYAAALAEAWTTENAAPGFMVTARDGKAVIYDKRGELVWAYDMWNVFSVQQSWDGEYMIGRDPGPFDLGEGGNFYRIGMDGSDFQVLDAPGGDHHDFTPIPGGIAYLAKTREGDCDKVYEASVEITDGAPVFDTWRIYQYFPNEGSFEGTEICHANRIHYLLDQDLYTISDRNKDALAVFSKDGTPVTSIGKAPLGDWTMHVQAESVGPGADWHVQHGHHFYANDKLVVFSNDSRDGSAILHYTLDGDSASLDWKYAGAGMSSIQGDVQRLPNRNFLITANLSGTIVEVSPDGQTEVARYALDGPIGPLYGFAYTRHRASLYGSPAPR